jgi:hypothetical protein
MDRMDPYQRTNENSGSDFGSQLGNLGQSFITYLKTRQPEHWLFLAVGVIVGLWIG